MFSGMQFSILKIFQIFPDKLFQDLVHDQGIIRLGPKIAGFYALALGWRFAKQ
jgi:hypothetical protein